MTKLGSIIDQHGREPRKGGGDFFDIRDALPNGGEEEVRLYRWGKDGDVVHTTLVHFHGKGKPPTDCTGDDESCRKRGALLDAGDEKSLAKAEELRPVVQWHFVGCRKSKPGEFVVWRPKSEYQGSQVLVIIATAGGYSGSRFPLRVLPDDDEATVEEKKADAAAFEQAVLKALPKICGPKGKSIRIKYDPKASPRDRYIMTLMALDDVEFPLPEDDRVISPQDVLTRMREAMEAKRRG